MFHALFVPAEVTAQDWMGFLGIATPLAWEDSKPFLKYVRAHGVEQFINMYLRLKVSDQPPTQQCRLRS